MEIKRIEDFLIEIALKIAREKKGCLFIIKGGELNYELQMENDFKSFNVLENGRRLELFAVHSGACIIDLDGNLINYSAKILNTKVYPNFGTRHGAAYTASLNGNIAILSSDDDLKVRVFRNGEMIQLDPFQKGIEKSIPRVTEMISDEFFKSMGIGTLGSLGITALIPTMGITFITGVILFGSPYFITKFIQNKGWCINYE
jgi:hypothetical protein